MPGVFQLSPDEIVREAEKAHQLGVPAVILFGFLSAKDEKASGAYARNGIVQQTVRLLKKHLPGLPGADGCLPVRIHEPRPLRHRRKGQRRSRGQ
jgi:delta-aminolevulinic acid dehydratase/porphobilinogen synthase